jgi:hypothetical protein
MIYFFSTKSHITLEASIGGGENKNLPHINRRVVATNERKVSMKFHLIITIAT